MKRSTFANRSKRPHGDLIRREKHIATDFDPHLAPLAEVPIGQGSEERDISARGGRGLVSLTNTDPSDRPSVQRRPAVRRVVHNKARVRIEISKERLKRRAEVVGSIVAARQNRRADFCTQISEVRECGVARLCFA